MTPKKRILFVDDEPAILSGLQNMLYKDRRRWDMVFVKSGAGALAELRAKPFDVVVTDMRMPGMDGAELLSQVKDEFPATVRIMLSGYAERDAIVRALPALHQLLAKPCDSDILRATIERIVDVRRHPALLVAHARQLGPHGVADSGGFRECLVVPLTMLRLVLP